MLEVTRVRSWQLLELLLTRTGLYARPGRTALLYANDTLRQDVLGIYGTYLGSEVGLLPDRRIRSCTACGSDDALAKRRQACHAAPHEAHHMNACTLQLHFVLWRGCIHARQSERSARFAIACTHAAVLQCAQVASSSNRHVRPQSAPISKKRITRWNRCALLTSACQWFRYLWPAILT